MPPGGLGSGPSARAWCRLAALRERGRQALLLAADASACALVGGVALPRLFPTGGAAVEWTAMVLAWLLCAGQYRLAAPARLHFLAANVAAAATIGHGAPTVMLLGVACGLWQLGVRAILGAALGDRRAKRRVLVCCTPEAAGVLVRVLRQRPLAGLHAIGLVTDLRWLSMDTGLLVLGPPSRLRVLAERWKVDEVIADRESIAELKCHGLKIQALSDVLARLGVPADDPAWLYSGAPSLRRPPSRIRYHSNRLRGDAPRSSQV